MVTYLAKSLKAKISCNIIRWWLSLRLKTSRSNNPFLSKACGLKASKERNPGMASYIAETNKLHSYNETVDSDDRFIATDVGTEKYSGAEKLRPKFRELLNATKR